MTWRDLSSVGLTFRMNDKREKNRILKGLPTARGFAAGPVFIYRSGRDAPIPQYLIDEEKIPAELRRLKRAQDQAAKDLNGLISVLKERTGHDDVRIFECHLMMLEDALLVDETVGYVKRDRLNAEAAVKKTADKARAQFARMNDPYFRERVRDLDDLERRLLNQLMGFSGLLIEGLKKPSIIVADDLTPSETVGLPRELVLGFVTDGGSATSHVALLARAMGIPAITGFGNITKMVEPGDTVLLDGSAGCLTLNPDAVKIREFADLVERQKELSEDAVMHAPAGTLKGGGEILLFANLHPGVPFEGLKEQGARGVGLYRSEYLWLNGEREPDEEEQFIAYRDAAKLVSTLGDQATLTIRALDIGGDKIARGLIAHEANPFLGNRSIRYLLAHREVLRTQLRAILRASAYGKICLMYPMVACVEELKACADEFEAVKQDLAQKNIPYDGNMPIGAMIEVPSAALNAEAFVKYVDFFSIGTNDLIQYTMAADRGNETVAYLYQPLNPAILELMRRTIKAARNGGIHVGVCGESASDPIIGVLWAAMGVDMLSMSATYIPAISKMLSRLTQADLAEYLKVVEDCGADMPSAEVYQKCREWLQAKLPDLDRIVL